VNVYWVDTGEQFVWHPFYEVVIAPDEERAKEIFLRGYAKDMKPSDITKIRLLAESVDRPEGFADPNDMALWKLVYGQSKRRSKTGVRSGG
jgi:hypothetical protein